MSELINSNESGTVPTGMQRRQLKAQRVQELVDSCQEQVLAQIIGPFGLSSAMFEDKEGGNVTTQHNADQGIFAKETEKFDRKNDYNYDKARTEKMNESIKNNKMDSNTFEDAYTGKREPTKRLNSKEKYVMNAELDHTVPLKQAHTQGGWMLEKEERTALASEKDNLNYITHQSNRSKGAKTPDEFLSPENGYDKERVDQIIEKAKTAVESHMPTTKDRAIYHGKEILLTGGKEAAQQAITRAMGVLLHELVNGTFTEVRQLMVKPEPQERFVDRVIEALKRVAERVKAKLGSALEAALGSGVQGFVSNLLTFLINNVITTSAKVVTIIRESMRGLWQAIKLVISPPPGTPGIEVARQATKIIAGVVTTSLGLLVEKSIEGFLLSLPLLQPLVPVLAPAVTALITGLMTALVVFGIDRFFDWASGTGTELLNAQIEHLEAGKTQIESMAQLLQAQFDSSSTYANCVREYDELQHSLAANSADLQLVSMQMTVTMNRREASITELKTRIEQTQSLHASIDRLLGDIRLMPAPATPI